MIQAAVPAASSHGLEQVAHQQALTHLLRHSNGSVCDSSGDLDDESWSKGSTRLAHSAKRLINSRMKMTAVAPSYGAVNRGRKPPLIQVDRGPALQ